MSVAIRYLEFDKVCLDLRHIVFSYNKTEPYLNDKYIIFLNVKRAIFCNFEIHTDMSLETLALYIYENVHYKIANKNDKNSNGDNVDYTIKQHHKTNFAHHIQFNENDKNLSIIINLDANARIVVAKSVRPDEKYHQRITGYLDFERRHQLRGVTSFATQQDRLLLDRQYETELLKIACKTD